MAQGSLLQVTGIFSGERIGQGWVRKGKGGEGDEGWWSIGRYDEGGKEGGRGRGQEGGEQ